MLKKNEAKTQPASAYVLDEQVGFILRQANQRHAAIFAASGMDDLTPTQWAALAKLREHGTCSQNLLGRHIAMDAATVKGVVQRLIRRGYVETDPDPTDARRVVLKLSPAGEAAYRRLAETAFGITAETLSPLTAGERETLVELLKKIR